MNSPRANAHVAIGGECCHEAENVSRAVNAQNAGTGGLRWCRLPERRSDL